MIPLFQCESLRNIRVDVGISFTKLSFLIDLIAKCLPFLFYLFLWILSWLVRVIVRGKWQIFKALLGSIKRPEFGCESLSLFRGIIGAKLIPPASTFILILWDEIFHHRLVHLWKKNDVLGCILAHRRRERSLKFLD